MGFTSELYFLYHKKYLCQSTQHISGIKMEFDLPPLNCLPGFEAAARHKSFTKAADELMLTQAAISFQVRNLENNLSVKLFLRQHRSLKLTEEGEALFGVVRAAFKALEAEKLLITGIKPKKSISISAPISYCSKWLLPRLFRFQSTEPQINILIDANDTLINLKTSGIQLAIRYCAAPPAEYHAIKLLEDDVFPVCNPQCILPKGRNMRMEDLTEMTFLTDEMNDHKWSEWLEATSNSPGTDLLRKHFTHTGFAVDAAIAGKGVAFGRLPLVAEDLDSGRLIRPFLDVERSAFAYYLLRSHDSLGNPDVDRVVSWLTAEAARTVGSFQRSTCEKSLLVRMGTIGAVF